MPRPEGRVILLKNEKPPVNTEGWFYFKLKIKNEELKSRIELNRCSFLIFNS
jgi:hypothetical protein